VRSPSIDAGERRPYTRRTVLIAAAVISIVIAVFYIAFFVVFPIGRGAVFFPSMPAHAKRMAELAAVFHGDRAVDLGSGDGRVVIALARHGAEAHGYEINPALVLLARWNIRRSGLQALAHVHWQSFWRVDLSRFQAVTVFQAGSIMKRLERKVRRELPAGARVVSDYWGFPGLPPARVDGTIHVYVVGAAGGGLGVLKLW
jgi:hypothetical protein